MKQINYVLRVKNVGSSDESAWNETMSYNFDNNVTEEQHGNELIERFNATLKPMEPPRVVVSITPINSNEKAPNRFASHQWEKKSLVTQKGGYDEMRCTICGAIGRRYGLGSGVKLMSKAKKYQSCKAI